jgi:hypothetical protein
MTSTLGTPSPAAVSERELRCQIDRCVSRALVDREFAQLLLADPTLALGGRGCTPQQYLELRSITAETITDFARQAVRLFWQNGDPRPHEEQGQHRSAAAM